MIRRRLTAFLFGAVVVLALVLLRALDPYPVRMARETSFDLFQQLKPRVVESDLPVRIVTIDEASLRELGQWPWPRRTMADIATRLNALGAAAVVFDVLFPEPDRLSPSAIVDGGEDYDARFAAALSNGPSILALSRTGQGATPPSPKSGFAVTGAGAPTELPVLDGVAAPLATLMDAASGLGVASLDRDGGGVARRLPLLWSSGSTYVPALALEALRVAQGVSTIVIMGDSAGAGGVAGLRIGDIAIPTSDNGDLWLYYRHLPETMFVPAHQVLTADTTELAPLLAGHIVLVGASATGLLDIRNSPLGEAVPGVSIHAQVIEQALTGTFLQRADWVGGLELLLVVAVGAAVVLALMLLGPLTGLASAGAVLLLGLGGSWLAFSVFGILLDPSFMLLGALVTYAAMAFFKFAVTDADRRRVRRAFAHYVEPTLLAQLEVDGRLLKLGGDVCDMTVMFSDVRNFSYLAERTSPGELVTILNRLFAVLGRAIVARMGTIDKFMGDAIMAFWNAPVAVPQHARQACLAALDMRKALAELNLQTHSGEPIAIGIGISTGSALVGNVGFEARFDYSCIGDTVNVASRLESACKALGYDILVTATTQAEASDLALLSGGSIPLKGMSDPEPIYLLVGDREQALSAQFVQLRSSHERLLEAWATGADAHDLLQTCRLQAQAVDVRLHEFYDTCLQRLGDFRPAQTERAAQLQPANP